jgi:solute carrier family 25 oxoglutarate transporter 11
MATTVIQPIDTVKVRIQLQEGKKGVKVNTNPFTVFGQIVKAEGPRALYTGLSAGLLRQLTYGTARMGVFQTMQEKLKGPDGTLSFSHSLLSSATAGGFGALVGTPADAALVRMQADRTFPPEQRRGYKNGVDAMFRMAREEGLKGFFSGASPTVIRGLAVNIGMLVSYDYFKLWLKPYADTTTQTNKFAAGALSGWTAATVSLPFDFIKTRLQKMKPAPDGSVPYTGFLDCCKKILAAEGAGAFYQGYFTYVIRITPHIMLTWVFLDNLKTIKFLK